MKRLPVFLLCMLMAACSNRSDIPSEIIPPDSMQQIMKDISMADNYSLDYMAKDSTKPNKLKASQDLLEIIFRLHHTSVGEFKKSLEFYESRPDLSKKIFDSLVADGNRHRADNYLPKGITTGTHPTPPVVKPNTLLPMKAHQLPAKAHSLPAKAHQLPAVKQHPVPAVRPSQVPLGKPPAPPVQ